MTKRILLLAALGAALMSCRQEEAPLPVPPEPVRMIAEDADPVRDNGPIEQEPDIDFSLTNAPGSEKGKYDHNFYFLYYN